MRYPKLWLIQCHFNEGELLSIGHIGKNAEHPEFCYLLCNHLKLKTWRQLTNLFILSAGFLTLIILMKRNPIIINGFFSKILVLVAKYLLCLWIFFQT